MQNVEILAITKNGVGTGLKILESFPEWAVHAPDKFATAYKGNKRVEWYAEPTSAKIASLFERCEGLVCLFSLGATIRLIAPHMKSKKTDPAVLVIDEEANFVISVLSGHIGGANRLAGSIAERLGAQPVITTAADVKGTIAVDMVGRDLGWVIEDDAAVTAVSALMVNGEKIGVYQDAGRRDWYGGGGDTGNRRQLPANVTIYETLEELNRSGAKAHLIISDKIITRHGGGDVHTVVYRPPTLIVGVGLHRDTTAETITGGIRRTLEERGLSIKSVAGLASIRKSRDGSGDVPGLAKAAEDLGVPLTLLARELLAGVNVPNPSRVVQAFEGTPSVSEAACMVVAATVEGGDGSAPCSLVVEKQKFPPDLTVAVARREAV